MMFLLLFAHASVGGRIQRDITISDGHVHPDRLGEAVCVYSKRVHRSDVERIGVDSSASCADSFRVRDGGKIEMA